jgi:hypothetical protein
MCRACGEKCGVGDGRTPLDLALDAAREATKLAQTILDEKDELSRILEKLVNAVHSALACNLPDGVNKILEEGLDP